MSESQAMQSESHQLGYSLPSNMLTFKLQEHGVSTDDPTSGVSPTQQEIHPAISSGDFGQVVDLKATRSLSDDEKFTLLKHCFVPSSCYNFPTCEISGHQRSFQHSWLAKYNGLSYSVSKNGGFSKFFCFVC